LYDDERINSYFAARAKPVVIPTTITLDPTFVAKHSGSCARPPGVAPTTTNDVFGNVNKIQWGTITNIGPYSAAGIAGAQSFQVYSKAKVHTVRCTLRPGGNPTIAADWTAGPSTPKSIQVTGYSLPSASGTLVINHLAGVF
jgi:hypothetical protein